MRVWRLCRSVHVQSSLDGLGGLYVSGRWHLKGAPIVYTAASPSLAALEMLVHLDPDLAPSPLTLLEIDVPESVSVEAMDANAIAATLVSHWQAHPPPVELQRFGAAWLAERRTAALRVPSAVMELEHNILINPAHPDAGAIRVVKQHSFSFDGRLL